MSIKVKFRFNLITLTVLIMILIESFIANIVNKTYATTMPQKYDLTSEISLVVKNQYQNGICPYMSISTLIESHVKLGQKKGKYSFIKKDPVFSVLTYRSKSGESDYCPTLTDKTEKILSDLYGLEMTEDTILQTEGLAESSLIVNAMQKIQPDLDVTLGGRSSGNACSLKPLPAIKKEYNNNSLVYKDGNNNTLTKAQVNEIRAEYKNFIMENGGIRCGVQTVGIKDGSNGNKVCFNKTKATNGSNHSVVIVGWDDTYSKNNFPASNRPSTDGAYIVQNSWGKDWGTNGKFYVSYEDLYIEEGLTGIEGVAEYKDTSEPEITVTDVGSGKLNIYATDKCSSGVNGSSLKYKWTDHNIKPNTKDSTWTSIKNDSEIQSQKDKYLWIYCEDKTGNVKLYCSGEEAEALKINDVESKCGVWMNKDIQFTIKGISIDENAPFEMLITSTSFTQDEIRNMEKIQDNNDHILTISKEGKHEIYLMKIENGEEYRAILLNVMIDKTKPSSPEIMVSDNKESNKYYEGANVTFKAGADTLSGVKGTSIEIKDKGGNNIAIDNNNKIVLSNIGIYTIKVTTTDNAGNSSSIEKEIEIVKKDGDSEQNNKNDTKDDDKKNDNTKNDNSKGDDAKNDDTKNNDSKGDNQKNDDSKNDNKNSGNDQNNNLMQDNSQKNNGSINYTDFNNSNIQQSDASKAHTMLPATGDNNEYTWIIIIATIIFIIRTIRSYKRLKGIK